MNSIVTRFSRNVFEAVQKTQNPIKHSCLFFKHYINSAMAKFCAVALISIFTLELNRGLAWPFSPLVVNQLLELKQLTNNVRLFLQPLLMKLA